MVTTAGDMATASAMVRVEPRAGTPARNFPTAIDLPPATRGAMVALLNRQLADTLDLYGQVKQAHGKSRGRSSTRCTSSSTRSPSGWRTPRT